MKEEAIDKKDDVFEKFVSLLFEVLNQSRIGDKLKKLEEYLLANIVSSTDEFVQNYFEEIGFHEKTVRYEERLDELERNTMETKNLLIALIRLVEKNSKEAVVREKRIEAKNPKSILRKKPKAPEEKEPTGNMRDFIIASVGDNKLGLNVRAIQKKCRIAGFDNQYQAGRGQTDEKAFKHAVSNALHKLKNNKHIIYERSSGLYFSNKK